MARWVKSHQQMQIFKTASAPTVLDGVKVGDIWMDITSGAVLKVCTAISPAVVFAVDSLDASGNFTASNIIPGRTSTATAAATTTLTVASTQVQVFTGSTTQTLVLPVVSTLTIGTPYVITNLSSGVVTVQSSGTNTVQAMQANSTLLIRSNAITGTDATVWTVEGYYPAASGQTGSGSLVRATSPALVTPTLGVASATSINFGQDALNYYDEGNFTPTFTFATPGDLSVVYVDIEGRYTRIGNIVYIHFFMEFTPTFTTASGAVRLGGLPFTQTGNNSPMTILDISNDWTWPVARTMATANVNNSSTFAVFNGLGTNVDASPFVDTSLVTTVTAKIAFAGSYRV